MNLMRGTGRRGLSSLKSSGVIKRPLLQFQKNELLGYANSEGIAWREDSTNSDERYLRNYIRLCIMPRFDDVDRAALLAMVQRAKVLNDAISDVVVDYLHLQPSRTVLDRHEFIMLPHAVAREVMAEWLLQNTSVELSRKILERLVHAAKTGRNNSLIDIDKQFWLKIDRKRLALIPRER
jgi:tRNA(Ile)-lysidine synthase TilS/MesJ